MIPHSKLFRLDTSNEYPFLPLLENMYSDSIFPLDVEIMQHTGYKWGKEVYEGDICDTHTRFGKGVVVFESAMFKINGISLCTFGKVEVIGNIYENPELLESEEK